MNALKQILKWVLITVVAFTTFNLFISSKYNLERSIEINSPAHLVYSQVADLETWKEWAIWWKQDSTLQTVFEGESSVVGSRMVWDGVEAGKGSLEIEVLSFADSINTILLFDGMQPSYGFWRFEENGGVTKVTWGMKGEMPFFMSFMTLFFDDMAGGDFEEGLKGLKERCESLPSRYSEVSEVDMPEQYYLYINTECAVHQIEETLGATYGEIFGYLAQAELQATGMPSARWISFPKTAGDENVTVFDAGVSINKPHSGTDRIKVDTFSARRTLQITHYGAYELSGNAHNLVDAYAQENNLTLDGIPVEVYANDPTTVAPEEVQTLIIYTIKE